MIFKKFVIFLLLVSFSNCEKSNNQHTITFHVKEGDSIVSVTRRLINEKLISHRIPFRIYAKLSGQDSKLKTGTYIIPPFSSYNKILSILTSGKSIGTLVTIPEGFNIFQIAYELEKHHIVSAKDFLTEVYKKEWLDEFHIQNNPPYTVKKINYIKAQKYTYAIPNNPPQHSLEGYLFPDTYSFEKNSSARVVVAAMVDRFLQIVDNHVLAEIKRKNKTLQEVIILASIIQKESTNNEEMEKVSGVYNNRLNIHMILQADPTLIYALMLDGEYHGNIRTKHVRPPWPSKYNTYYNKSLPPGPIANPGRKAILATINPEKHNYLYFVATPHGGHKYSRTYAEHKKAVETWVQYKEGK